LGDFSKLIDDDYRQEIYEERLSGNFSNEGWRREVPEDLQWQGEQVNVRYSQPFNSTDLV